MITASPGWNSRLRKERGFPTDTNAQGASLPALYVRKVGKSRTIGLGRKFQVNTCATQFRLDYSANFRMLQVTMKKPLSVSGLAGIAFLALAIAPAARAHERDTFRIGSNYYVFTVGSLNEPFVVDTMSGVDLRVSQVAGPGRSGASKAKDNGTPVTGLEQTLKVELTAGDKKETLAFDPSDEAPGFYTANFIPTVQTTYGYRIFGTVNGSPFDFTFTCVPGEGSETAEDASQVKVSETITRVNKVGSFGCPAERKAMGFPEPALSSYDLDQKIGNIAAGMQAAGKQASTAEVLSIIAIIIGVSGLAVAAISFKRKQDRHS